MPMAVRERDSLAIAPRPLNNSHNTQTIFPGLRTKKIYT